MYQRKPIHEKVGFLKWCEEKEKCKEIRQSHKLINRFSSNLVCKVVYIKGIKYIILVQISPVVLEIQGVENGNLVVPVNNTLEYHLSFLATGIQPCALMLCNKLIMYPLIHHSGKH